MSAEGGAPQGDPAARESAMRESAARERPNRFPWPPVLAVALFVAGLTSRQFIPDIRLGLAQIVIGAALAMMGAALIVAAFAGFTRARSNILPHRPADRLITAGVFRLSRNPIYTGEVLAIFGIGLALGAAGLMIAALALAVLVLHLGIKREEAHLAARFGADWDAYKSRVRRWL